MKLVKPAQFNRPKRYVMETPYLRRDVAGGLLIIILADNSVQLLGPVGNLELARSIFKSGLERLEEYHKANDSAGPVLLGADGQPVTNSGNA